jgi:hypothetical protein|tara:strand:- start:81 stop:368 length:288 start_codon:yes stop_codon:yes gene_type:complete
MKQGFNSFIGRDENALIRTFGIPAKIYNQKNGGKVMEWVLQGAYPSQDVVYNPFDGTFGAVGSFGTYGCRWTYFINKKGKAETFNYNGNCNINFN